MITLELIKAFVEKESGLDDISIKLRTDDYAYARFIYAALGKKHTDRSLQKIGRVVGKEHCFTIHALKKVEKIFDTGMKDYINLYNKVDTHIQNYLKNLKVELENFDDVKQIKSFYKQELLRLRFEHVNELEQLKTDNEKIKETYSLFGKNLIEDVSKLTPDELIELQDRIKLFLKVKAKLNENRFVVR